MHSNDPSCTTILSCAWGTTGRLILCTVKTESSSMPVIFSMTVQLCKHQREPYIQKETALSLSLLFEEWVFPLISKHEYRVAGISSLLFRRGTCGGSGVDSGGHHSASLLLKPGTLSLERSNAKFIAFSPQKQRMDKHFEAYNTCKKKRAMAPIFSSVLEKFPLFLTHSNVSYCRWF